MLRKYGFVGMDIHVINSFFSALLLLLVIEVFCFLLSVVLREKLHHCLSCHLCL